MYLMARAWETQSKSTVMLPGQAIKRCWKVNACVEFSSILSNGLWRKTRQGEELEESCWHAGKIWLISPGSLHNNVGAQAWMAQSRPIYDPMFSTTTTTPRQIVSGRGLHGLWMFGDTGQAMGVHLRSTSHGGHGY